MSDSYTLPFELTADAIDQWLVSVERLAHLEKVNLFNRIITQLHHSPVEAGAVFLVLDKLTETYLMLCNILEHIAANEKKANPSAKATKLSALAIQFPKKLCFAYGKLADNGALTTVRQTLCLYRAMQILGLLIKRNTLFYEAPDLSLWKKLGELYLKAKSGQLLTVEIDDKVPGLMPQATIEAVLKQIVFFYSCNAYPYAPAEIAAIFSVTAELAGRLRLDPEPSGFTPWYWNPYSSLPPLAVNPDKSDASALFINTSELIDYFEGNIDKLDKYQALAPVFNRLTAYSDIRRSVNPASLSDCGLLIGTGQALKFLNVLTSRYRILELSGAMQQKPQSSRLELVPLEGEKNALAFLSTKILKDDFSASVARIKTYETNSRNFCAAKIGNLECSMDEPVILVYENQPPYFALIRHLRMEAGIKLKNLLMEIIDGSIYPVEIAGAQCFLIARLSGKVELFVPEGGGRIDDTVLFTAKGIADKTFRIDKFIELTAHFSRYQVSVC